MRIPINRNKGFTLVEIMIVIAIIGLLVVVALPNMMRYRTEAQKKACIENLSKMDAAKQIWGVEHGKHDGDLPTDDELFGAELYIKEKPECPSGGTYHINAIGVAASCTEPGHEL